MPDATATPPRSAAARRAEKGPQPDSQPSSPVEAAGPDPALSAVEAELQEARAEAERAREDARLAREEAEMLREQAALGPIPAAEPTLTIPAPPAEPSAAALAASSGEQAAPGGVVPPGAAPAGITPAEMDLLRRIREGRDLEILQRIREAPARVGTDLDKYTLVHLRGCPKPDRTETYPAQDPAGQRYTVHRCVECGAHLAIPH